MCLTLRFLGTEKVVSTCSACFSWATFRRAMASFDGAHQMLFASFDWGKILPSISMDMFAMDVQGTLVRYVWGGWFDMSVLR